LGIILRGLAEGEAVRPAFTSIVARSTAERPDDRYASALDLRDEIGRYLDGAAVLAHRESFSERAARLFDKHQTAVLLIAAYLVARLLSLIVLGR